MEIEFNGFRIILIELASSLNVRRYLTFMQKSFFLHFNPKYQNCVFRPSLIVCKDASATSACILRDLGCPNQTPHYRHPDYLLMVSPVPHTGTLMASVTLLVFCLTAGQSSACASESTLMLDFLNKTFLLSP